MAAAEPVAAAVPDEEASPAPVALAESSVEAGAEASPEAAAWGASTEGPRNALHANILSKGSNAYYYAHASTSVTGLKTTLGDGPRLVARGPSEAGAAASAADRRPVRPITKYAWADDGAKVRLYVDWPAAAASLPEGAASIRHGKQGFELRVEPPGGEVHALIIRDLHAPIAGAALKRCKERLLVTLTKAEELPWWELRKGGSADLGDDDF